MSERSERVLQDPITTLWNGKPGVKGELRVERHCGTLVEGRPVLGSKSEIEKGD